jgi:Ca2+-binding EF-hand superfamily protein
MAVKTSAFGGVAALLSVACMLNPPVAAAQARDPVQLISEADANGDGAVSWAEVVSMRTQTFARLDRNKDGYISSSDRPRGAFGQRFDQAFGKVKGQFDANGDNRVSRAEMVDAPSPVFDRGDTNGDRILSAEELAALRSAASKK